MRYRAASSGSSKEDLLAQQEDQAGFFITRRHHDRLRTGRERRHQPLRIAAEPESIKVRQQDAENPGLQHQGSDDEHGERRLAIVAQKQP